MKTRARPVTKAEETAEFKEFWDGIWHDPVRNVNDGRGDARDEFFRHVEEHGVDPQDIIDGARWFVFKGGNSEFKQHAKTWLNRRQYEDGAEDWRSHQARQSERQGFNVISMPGPRGQTAYLKSLKQSESSR